MRIAMMVIAALLVALGWHANRLSHDIDGANRIIGTLSAGIESRDNAITRLQDEARQQAVQSVAALGVRQWRKNQRARTSPHH